MPLNARKQAFVDEYLVDLNASAAAIRAGYSPRGAKQAASRLMAEPAVQDAVDAAMAMRSERTYISADRVLRELGRIAFANIGRTATWAGGRITMSDSGGLTEDELASIAEISETRTGRQSTLKIKQHDKLAALRLLMPHVGLKAAGAEDEDVATKARRLLDMMAAMEASVVGPSDTKVDPT